MTHNIIVIIISSLITLLILLPKYLKIKTLDDIVNFTSYISKYLLILFLLFFVISVILYVIGNKIGVFYYVGIYKILF